MLAMFVARLETPTPRLISAIALIALGTALASFGEINLNVLGIIFMFSSETFEAIRLVMTQTLLTGLKFHPSTPHDCQPPNLQRSCVFLRLQAPMALQLLSSLPCADAGSYEFRGRTGRHASVVVHRMPCMSQLPSLCAWEVCVS